MPPNATAWRAGALPGAHLAACVCLLGGVLPALLDVKVTLAERLLVALEAVREPCSFAAMEDEEAVLVFAAAAVCDGWGAGARRTPATSAAALAGLLAAPSFS